MYTLSGTKLQTDEGYNMLLSHFSGLFGFWRANLDATGFFFKRNELNFMSNWKVAQCKKKLELSSKRIYITETIRCSRAKLSHKAKRSIFTCSMYCETVQNYSKAYKYTSTIQNTDLNFLQIIDKVMLQTQNLTAEIYVSISDRV